MSAAARLPRVLLVLALLELSGSGALFAQGGSSPSGDLATYTNRQYAFTLRYPKQLTPVEGSDSWSAAVHWNGKSENMTGIVTLSVFEVSHDSTKPYPYPLFFSTWVSVGVSPDTAHCYEAISNDGSTTDVTIGGVPFKAATLDDAGMMKYSEVTTYRTIHDGACYAVEQVERGSTYSDENTQPGLSDGQLQAYYDQAGVIARSFRFTDVSTPSAAPSSATSAAPPAVPSDAVTLKFARGATRILVKDSLAAGGSRSYVLGAGAGQLMVLSAHGEGTDPLLAVTSLPDGVVLQPASAGKSGWAMVFARTQDILVRAMNPGPATTFELSVMVPAIVTPRAGSPVTRNGSTPGGLPVDYFVRVMDGWILDATVESAGRTAVLRTTGLVSGSSLVAAAEPAVEATDRLELKPSGSQDYVISVVPRAGAVTDYRLGITVRPGS